MSTPVVDTRQIIDEVSAGRLKPRAALQALQQLKDFQTIADAQIPLSEGQRGLWINDRLNRGAIAYNVPWCFRVRGELDLRVLETACRHLVTEHPILSSHVEDDGITQLHRCQSPATLTLVCESLENLSSEEIRRRIEIAAKEPFDLANELPIRFSIFTQSSSEHFLLITVHHIVIDGRSAPLLLSGLFSAYERALAGDILVAKQNGGVYREFVDWEQNYLSSAAGERDRQFWLNSLSGSLPTIVLPGVRVRAPNNIASKGTTLCKNLSTQLSTSIRGLARSHRVNCSVVFMAVYQALLHRYSGETDIIVGMPSMRRPQEQFDALIGYFINLLPLRQNVVGDQTFGDLLSKSQLTLADALDHAHYPFARIISDLNLTRADARAPVFKAAFGYQNAQLMTLPSALEGLAGRRSIEGVDGIHQESEYELLLEILEQSDNFRINLKFNAALCEEMFAARMLEHVECMLRAVVDDPDLPVARVPLLPEDEVRRILSSACGHTTVVQQIRCLHEEFELAAAERPDSIAVLSDRYSLTYRELDERANALAHMLHATGVKSGCSRVAICVDRGPELAVAWIATLKAGAAFVPLDPTYPLSRLSRIFEDCTPDVLLVDIRGHQAFGTIQTAVPQIRVDELGKVSLEGRQRLSARVSPSDLAYIVYTSGSSGEPKGVMVEHRQVLNLVGAMTARYELLKSDRVLQFVSPSFDVAIQEIFIPLLFGACVVFRSAEWISDASTFWRMCEGHGVTIAHLPAAYWQQLNAQTESALPGNLRLLIIGGEAVGAQALSKWFERRDRPRLLNQYGPTETTVTSTVYEFTSAGDQPACIGQPISNVQIYILDEHQQLTPIGVPGELYIGGDGVGRGYLNRLSETTNRYCRNPLSSGHDRIYRTGDRARWLSNGTIEFLGRIDQQVKLRGFRIELGEIETYLRRCVGVEQALVTVQNLVADDRSLVAYVTSGGTQKPRPVDLRAQLACHLPKHMIPAAFVVLTAFPLSANGKVDRGALPEPGAEAFALREYEAPNHGHEEVLAECWRNLLGVDRIGRQDDFFELGGHSLLAVQLTDRIRKVFGAELTLVDVFTQSRLCDLSQRIVTAVSAEPHSQTLTARDRTRPPPLSVAQQRLWFITQLDTEASKAYHIPMPLLLIGKLDRTALQQSFDRLIQRHEVLRTYFRGIQGKPVQVTAPPDAEFQVRYQDLEGSDPDLGELVSGEIHLAFDLDKDLPIRALLVRLAADRHALVITFHHIVFDGWSVGIVASELSAFYESCRQGAPHSLPELEIQYADYASWQQEHASASREQKQLDYWTKRLQGAPVRLDLPADRPRPAQQQYAGAVEYVQLDRELIDDLKSLGRSQGATLYMTLLASWALLLSRLSGQRDLILGTPVANRNHPRTENLIGFFVNTLPIRLVVEDSNLVSEFLRRVRMACLEAQDNQDIPFEQIVEAVAPPRTLAHTPLFQVLFAWQNVPQAPLSLPGLTVALLAPSSIKSQFELSLALQEVSGAVTGTLTYATSIFDAQTVREFLSYWIELLRSMVKQSHMAVDSLVLLGPSAQRRTIARWNEPCSPSYDHRCIHEIFEEQAALTPDAIAVTCGTEQLSYRDLNRRANQLARHLQKIGVRPDARVALCLERGMHMLIGIVAILKAGGGYVPLDPSYPAERHSFVLKDSAPVALLTESKLITSLSWIPSALQCVLIDEEQAWTELGTSNQSSHELPLNSRHLAYVIYTSGSTGQPKGVMVEHGNVTRLFEATRKRYDFTSADVWTLFHSHAFDFSVWEIWGALLKGGRLVIVPQLTTRDPAAFFHLVCREGVTVLNQTPSAFRQFVKAQSQNTAEHGLRYVIFGGEAFDVSVLNDWYALNSPDKTRLVNMYGITETTVHVTSHELTPQDLTFAGKGSPIGVRIPDLRIYLLDPYGVPVPEGVIGELYVGGAGVARGYLNRPDLTAQRFVNDHFMSKPEAKMYRTGDLGRRRRDGTIEFIGRNDQQVKVRGFRIELGEIEACIRSCKGVREAVVLVRESPSAGPSLIGYFTVPENSSAPSATDLRARLAEQIPDHMIPGAFVQVTGWPLTENGKLDVSALPSANAEAFVTTEYHAPVSPAEVTLADVWKDLLGFDRVGRTDHFFQLGGHSLLIVQMIEQLRNRGWILEVRAVFTHPRLAGLAEMLRSMEGGRGDIQSSLIPSDCIKLTPEMLTLVQLTPGEIEVIEGVIPGGAANIQDVYPLVPLQEGILFHHLLGEAGDPYLLNFILSFDSRERLNSFLNCLQAVIERHDILRTSFHWQGLSEPVQVVWRRASLPVEEISIPHGEDAIAHIRVSHSPRQMRIDVRRAPLMRAVVAQDPASGRAVLSLFNHHLIDDQTTLKQMMVEVQCHMSGIENRLPPPVPFRNFVATSRGGVSEEEHEALFKRLLGDVTEPTLPFGLGDTTGDGGAVQEARTSVTADVTQSLRRVASDFGVTSAAVLHLAWACVLARICGHEDVVFGTVLFGRTRAGAGAAGALGLFINTLPVRINLRETSAASGLVRMHEILAQLLHHEQAPLAVAQRCSAVPAPAPLFSALLNCRQSQPNQELGRELEGAWEGIEVHHGEDRTNYPITLSIDDLGDTFQLTAQVSGGINPEVVCSYMTTALNALTETLRRSPNHQLLDVEVLPAADAAHVMSWAGSNRDFGPVNCVHDLFVQRATETPNSTALVYGSEQWTYERLHRDSDLLADYLVSLGVGSDLRVAICIERSLELIAGLLAILKAGGAYVPLDPHYPTSRLQYILQDAKPSVLITEGHLTTQLAALVSTDCKVIDLHNDRDSWNSVSEIRMHESPGTAGPDNLAYVIYTSGSTGRPKGVAMPHRPLVNLIRWQSLSTLRQSHRTLQFAALGFDVSAQEIFSTLGSGGTLVLLDENTRRDPAALCSLLSSARIERLFLPSVALEQLAEAAQLSEVVLPDLQEVITAGDQLRITPTIRALFARHRACRLYNQYGPTETHVVTAAELAGDPEHWPMLPSIGTPVDNARLYILNTHGRLAPPGVIGEICVGGAALARGYWGRSDATAERFVSDTLSGTSGGRLYKTGDLGRWLADGSIQFMGRNDDQVKIRGFRVELGEVEVALKSIQGVRDAVVSVYESTPGHAALVAYVIADDNYVLQAAALRESLERKLPAYMVPSSYQEIEALPVSPNGKVNRRGLPAPKESLLAAVAHEEPQGSVEEAIAQTWRELLAVDRVGRADNFFALGGHSLMIVRMIERLRRLGISAQARTIYESPTLAALARSVGDAQTHQIPDSKIPLGCTRLTPAMLPLLSLTQEEIDRVVELIPGRAANIEDVYSLAPLQEGILFHHLRAEHGDPYLLNFVLEFESRERLGEFLDALQRVVDRHGILRTSFHWEGLSQPVQVVWRQAQLPTQYLPLEVSVTETPLERIRALANPRDLRLSLNEAPLLRAVVGEQTNGRQILSLFNHHLVCDHTTLEQMLAEIHGSLQTPPLELMPAIPFRNFVWQSRNGINEAEHRKFFLDMLGDVDEVTSPFGLGDVQGDGTRIVEARRMIDMGLASRLRRCARQLNVSPATLFHVAFARVLASTSGRDDVVFGTVLIGRMDGGEGADRSLGLFINTLPIRIRMAGCKAADAVSSTHRLLSQLLRHEHASLAIVQRCSGVAPGTPVFSALLNYRHSPVPRETPSQMELWPGVQMLHVEDRTNYPLTVSVDDLEHGFGLTAQVVDAVNPEHICEYVETALSGLVNAIGTEWQLPLSQVSALPVAMRHQLLIEWNATDATFPSDKCIHQLFEAQVARTPEAIALEFEGRLVTYSRLNQLSNQLARKLVSLGVRPDSLVAVCLERGVPMVQALLAVLKSGGAYVPVDPNHPVDRIRHYISDASPTVILTQSKFVQQLSSSGPPVVALDTDWAGGISWSAENLEFSGNESGPRNLAYVIYTSGSTGEPKGAMNEHRSVVNRLCWMQAQYPLDHSDRVLQKTPFTFDVSVWEFFLPLSTGARLVLARPDGHRDPHYLIDLMYQTGVTVTHFVPSMLRVFVEHLSVSNLTSLRRVICSGEELTASVAQLFSKTFPNVALENLYGPTECAVDVTYWSYERAVSSARIPIGRPIWNTSIYILDATGQPTPIGAVGELHIGGVAVGRGYWNRPALTQERFLADPFSTDTTARMYRTGDLARYRPNGLIEFLGRNDSQIKINGLRIEPEEISARLREVPGIRDATTLLREDVPGDKRLVAYVIGVGNLEDSESLRSRLEKVVPDYMIPSAFVKLEEWPLTPSGKLDRRSLPPPRFRSDAQEFELPEAGIESALAQIWKDLLGCDRVGRHDDFFRLGGHSLLIIQVMVRLRGLGYHMQVRDVFDAPTLCELAKVITTKDCAGIVVAVPANRIPPGCTSVTPDMIPLVNLTQQQINNIAADVQGGCGNIEDIYPLAPLQEGILFHHLIGTDRDPYVLKSLLRFQSRETLETFIQAYQLVIDRHDILRTSFYWEGLTDPVQVVWRSAKLVLEDAVRQPSSTDTSDDAPSGTPSDWREAVHRLNAHRAPLMRAVVVRADSNGICLALFSHHLIADHTTIENLLKEVRAFLVGEANILPDPAPYRNFVFRARDPERLRHYESFFKDLLSDVTEPSAPFGLLNARGNGAEVSEAHAYIEHGLGQRLRTVARNNGVSAAALLHLAWARVISRTTASEDVVFGTVLLGRMHGPQDSDRMLGLLLNTLPVRVKSGDVTVAEGLQKVQHLLAQLMTHEQAPLSLAQHCSAIPRPAPLFCSLLNYRHSYIAQTPSESTADPWAGIEFVGTEERTNYPVTLNVDDLGEKFLLTAQVSAPIDAAEICRYMTTAVEYLVEALEEVPQTPLHSIDILRTNEKDQLLRGPTSAQPSPPIAEGLDALLDEQFKLAAGSTALRFAGKAISYGELDNLTSAMANHLMLRGVGPEVVVGLCLTPSIDRILATVAVLRAGGAVLPLEPSLPVDRLELMINESHAHLILTEQSLLSRSPAYAQTICLDRDRALFTRDVERVERRPAILSQLAFVMFTSASTGMPKAVNLEHGSIVNRIAAQRRIIPLMPDDVCLHKTSVGFVDAILEVLDPLTSGRVLTIAAESAVQDAAALIALIERMRVTRLLTVPSLAQAIVELPMAAHCLAKLRSWSLSGETFGLELLARLRARLPNCRFLNFYGSTEVTADVTVHDADGTEIDSVPIGKPLLNNEIYILDERLRPLPRGATGEIYVSGRGLARGYGRPELTAERFIETSLGNGSSRRLFKTGDLGCYWDGVLQYRGRRDHQVKIRGYRIELGEIEAALRGHAHVIEAVVIAGTTTNGETRLAAYVSTGDMKVSPDDLRLHLKQKLPRYMVPAEVQVLRKLPLTPTGKFNRHLLASMSIVAAPLVFVEPRGATEIALAKIWHQVLGRETISATAEFFDVGGHSLLGTRLISQVAETFGVKLPLQVLFDAPTIQQLASSIESKRGVLVDPGVPPLERRPLSASAPLSPNQAWLWQLHQDFGGGRLRSLVCKLRLVGDCDTVAMSDAWNAVLGRHEILRSRIEVRAGAEHQVVHPPCPTLSEVEDLADFPAKERQQRLDYLTDQESSHRIDLEIEPGYRLRLVRIAAGEHLLLVALHPLLCDEWSMYSVIRELCVAYGAMLRSENNPLPELPLQFNDFAVWQCAWINGEVAKRLREYWRDRLRDRVDLRVFSTAEPHTERDPRSRVLDLEITEAVLKRLRRLALSENTTLYAVLLSAFQIAVSELSRQTDVVIGTRVTGRQHWQTQSLVGPLANTIIIRTSMESVMSFRDVVRRVNATVAEAGLHQALPISAITLDLHTTACDGRPQVEFNWHSAQQEFEIKGLKVLVESIEGGAYCPEIALHVLEGADRRLALQVRYLAQAIDEQTIQCLANSYLAIVRHFAVRPDTLLERVSALVMRATESYRFGDFSDTQVS